MKIISWNINGLRSGHKKGLLDFLKAEKPDIFCAQEIKCDFDSIPEEFLNLDGYKIFINSARKKGYSGTMILTKKDPDSHSFKVGYDRFDSEGRFIRIDFSNFIFINVYMPQGGRDKANLPYKLESYRKILSYLSEMRDKKIIIAGDFNIAHQEIDLARPKQNKNNIMFTGGERKKIDELLQTGFADVFRDRHPKSEGNYTWWPYFADARNRNLGWRIDYVFSSKAFSKSIKNVYILKDVYGSDHCPIGINL